MSFESHTSGTLNYLPCRYGTSRLLFRGPRKSLEGRYVLFLGGTETYGKYIARPYPDLIEDELGVTCVNLGQPNAGVDAFANDTFVAEAAQRSRVCVLQLTTAQNISNRLYTVHPRRNDRFVAARPMLRTLFPDVDFSAFNFTGHLLSHLSMVSPERYRLVRTELQEAWEARHRSMLTRIGGRIVLLWFAGRSPDDAPEQEPLYVTRAMVDALCDQDVQVVEVCSRPMDMDARLKTMIYPELEVQAAKEMLGTAAHHQAAQALTPVLKAML